MKIKSFWLQFSLLMILTLILCSIGVAWSVSHFYSAKNNQLALKELNDQSLQERNALLGNLKFLISDLITWQTRKIAYNAPFTVLGVMDKRTRHVVSVRPASFVQKIKHLKIETSDFKKFPVVFYSLNEIFDGRAGQVLLLVDVDQIQSSSLPQHLSSQKILFGLLSSKGFSVLSRSLRNHSETFLLGGQKNWMPVHSQLDYSGRFLSSQSPFRMLKKNHSEGWSLPLKSKNILSVGIPIGISDAYLVLNKKMYKWDQYFYSILYEVFLVVLGVGMIMLIPFYIFLNPLREAYLYLARLLKRYAIWNTFPAPNHNGDNVYIRDVQPNLEKLFWKLREDRLSSVQGRDALLFSGLVSRICKENLKYPHIEVNTHFESDIQLSKPTHWLEQALIEILKNAVECMNAEGKIDIYTHKEDGVFCCEIRDYGPGMSAMVMNQACRAYYSSKPRTNKGLGLTLAYSALSRAGCQLYFNNATDGDPGLIVQISIPLDKEVGYSVSHGSIYDSYQSKLG